MAKNISSKRGKSAMSGLSGEKVSGTRAPKTRLTECTGKRTHGGRKRFRRREGGQKECGTIATEGQVRCRGEAAQHHKESGQKELGIRSRGRGDEEDQIKGTLTPNKEYELRELNRIRTSGLRGEQHTLRGGK